MCFQYSYFKIITYISLCAYFKIAVYISIHVLPIFILQNYIYISLCAYFKIAVYISIHVLPIFILQNYIYISLCTYFRITIYIAIHVLPIFPMHVRSWCDESSDPLNYFSFLPVLHDWCNKGRGMCYPVCGMMHIK